MVPNRWRIPVGAVLVHICIGSVYAWSTFNRPNQALFPDSPWWFSPPYTTFTTALALLGLSAAFGGPWVERRGPRVAASWAAVFFGVGLQVGGLGLALRKPFLVFLGMGLTGGVGCGLGYISPVSTLVNWFPDRRGMATGWKPAGWSPPAKSHAMIADRSVTRNEAVGTVQFYLLWESSSSTSLLASGSSPRRRQ